VGVPDEIDFKSKPEIALEQIEATLKAGIPRGLVLMDAGYGCPPICVRASAHSG